MYWGTDFSALRGRESESQNDASELQKAVANTVLPTKHVSVSAIYNNDMRN